MNKLQQFQSAARENGYVQVNEYDGGNAAWFRKALPDAGTDVHKRLCVDSLTDSATVFWQTVPAKLNSKTFRTVSTLKTGLIHLLGSGSIRRRIPSVRLRLTSPRLLRQRAVSRAN